MELMFKNWQVYFEENKEKIRQQAEERKEIIVEGYDTNQNTYIVYNYLDKYYAMVGDKISFSIVTDRKEKIMNVFLRFKIQYYDLIGNRYEQEFRFAFYDDFNGKNKKYYNLNNISYLPIYLN